MFDVISNLFGGKKSDEAAAVFADKPIASEPASENGSVPGRKGRPLTPTAVRAQSTLVSVLLGSEPKTKAKILEAIPDQEERDYLSDNWNGVTGRLMAVGSLRRVGTRGRNVSYILAS